MGSASAGCVPPLPVERKIRPEPSETRPPPDCQIPAPETDGLSTAVQRAVIWPAVDTPATQP